MLFYLVRFIIITL